MAELATQEIVASDVTVSVDAQATAVQEVIDTAIATKIAADPSLQSDYAERDRLDAERKANAVALAAVRQRIAQKEGPELAVARAKQELLAMPPEKFLAMLRRPGMRG